MGRKLIDLTGQTFGRWTVLERAENAGKQPCWICQCGCNEHTIKKIKGSTLRDGGSKSCGCWRREFNQVDLTGQRFGKLIVLESTSQRSGTQVVWKCQCDCGQICFVGSNNLKNGHTLSCGCLRKENSAKFKDLTGQQFGLLKVLEITDQKDFSNYIWKCECQCAQKTICYVSSNRLLMGRKLSCGCNSISNGELKIQQLLQENGIPFERQKVFDTCRDKLCLPFDFFVNNQYLIEFDGEQHERATEFFGGRQSFIKTQQHDQIKNQWCKNNNVPLIRIPYRRLKNLSILDLLLETSSFLLERMIENGEIEKEKTLVDVRDSWTGQEHVDPEP